MAPSKYLTSPPTTDQLPGGIPYIIGNEVAERFSFYGMRTILVIVMTKYLLSSDGSGAKDVMTEDQAKEYFHLFVTAVYFFPLLGAIISDAFFGKYRTIMWLSIVYCLGHLALAIDETRLGLFAGLSLISIGAGGIKPCVSAHVGDQFGARNQHFVSKVFVWFYFAINLGAFTSTLLTPWLLEQEWLGPKVAFGIPGVLMFLATVTFWMGRNKFVHVPPGGTEFIRQSYSGEGLKAMLNLFVIYIFVAMFWALFDQSGSSWVLQAKHMDRRLFGIDWSASQFQAVNPILILTFIPLFSFVIYPAFDRIFPLTPLRKISIGLFVAAVPFAICAWVEARIQAGETPSIHWQILAYAFMTAAEIFVSITCLEFSYTQAPKAMKSFIMSLYLLSVSMGNLFTAIVNFFIQNRDGSSKLEGPNYFWFFTGVMLVTAVAFIFVAMNYSGRTYIQGEAQGREPSATS